jgi:hypothetical protein
MGENILNILYVTETKSGCYKARSVVPKKYLEKRGHTVHIAENGKSYKDIDVTVFFRGFHGQNNVAEFARSVKEQGSRVIYDTDDALGSIERHNAAYRYVKDAEVQTRQLLKEVDAITTTTEELKGRYAPIKPSFVLPNSMDLTEWRERNHASDRLRIGYSGGVTHIKDIMIILDVVRELQEKNGFIFVLHGFSDFPTLDSFIEYIRMGIFKCDPVIFNQFEKIHNKLQDIEYEFHPAVNYEWYPESLRSLDLDIGLCPLEDTPFNRSKSCIKFYEYSLVGTTVLTSDVLPYSREVTYRARNEAEWRKKLERLITDNQFRESLHREQKQWVMENRDMARNVALWEQAYGILD